MIDFNYTAPELLPFRIREVLDAPNEPHRIGGVVYVPEGGEAVMNNLQYIVKDDTRFAMHMAVELCEQGDFDSVAEAARWLMSERDDAAMRRGECHLDEVDTYSNANEVIRVLECSACGQICEHVNGSYPRCPHCGRKEAER